MAYEKIFATKDYISKTIATGVLTLDDWGICYLVDGEGSAADDLVTISGGAESQFLIIKSAVNITLKHGTGNIVLASGADVILTAGLQILLVLDSAGKWTDFLNVATPDLHGASHENGGGDEISLAGLSGEPADTVNKSLFNANSILAADEDNTPAALEIAEQRVVGRITGGNIAGLTPAQILTLALSVSLPENTAIMLEDVLSADGKYTGIVMEGTAGAALAFGDVCYLQTADARWELADNDAASTATNMLGVCVLAAAGDGSATKMLLLGTIRADTAFPDVTKGAPVYLDSTAGDLTSTLPTKTTSRIVRILGHGWYTANEIYFNPSPDWVEYA